MAHGRSVGSAGIARYWVTTRYPVLDSTRPRAPQCAEFSTLLADFAVGCVPAHTAWCPPELRCCTKCVVDRLSFSHGADSLVEGLTTARRQCDGHLQTHCGSRRPDDRRDDCVGVSARATAPL